MKRPLVTDELWSIIEPLLPAKRPKPKGGRPRVADRAVLTGILFVLRSGIPWEILPQEMGCGFGRDVLAPTARLAGNRVVRRAGRTRWLMNADAHVFAIFWNVRTERFRPTRTSNFSKTISSLLVLTEGVERYGGASVLTALGP